MRIQVYKGQELKAAELRHNLLSALESTRFTVKAIEERPFVSNRCAFQFQLRIVQARLKQPKDYCGNHAGPCKLPNKVDKKMTYLEGKDWASFNNLVNDVLDTAGVHAYVFTADCCIRLDKRRRIAYHPSANEQEFEFMAPQSDYVAASYYPVTDIEITEGTPGELSY